MEDKLYRYFKMKEEIKEFESKLIDLENYLKNIDEDKKRLIETIKKYKVEANDIEFDNIYCIRNLKKELLKLEEEYTRTLRKIMKINYKLRNGKMFIKYIYKTFAKLDSEDIEFINLKYRDNKNILEISNKMNMSNSTVYRKRDKLLEKLEEII